MENEQIRRKNLRGFYLDSYKDYIVIIRRDITDLYNEEMQQQEILKKAVKEAEAANNAKTEFFSRMSHDMRTPMNGILGITALSMKEESSDVLKENIRKIHESGE